MKICLTTKASKLYQHLDTLKSKKVIKYKRPNVRDNSYQIKINTSSTLEELDLKPLFSYNIFPGNVMSFFAEWEISDRKMESGDTVVQQINLLPFSSLSPKLIAGVKIKQVINQPRKKGFTYETLDGHPETGVATFMLEQKNNETFFRIMTSSAEKSGFYGVFSPVFRSTITRKVLKKVKNQLENN